MASAHPPAAKCSHKILIVEDEPAPRFLATQVMEYDGGFRVLMATLVDESFGVLGQNDYIECVFTDIKMPGRHEGLELARGVLTDHPGIKVVITSVNGYVQSPVSGVPFLHKP